MGLYQELLDSIDERRERLKQGKVNAISYGLPRLDKHIPGITKESMTTLTTVTGAGKTGVSTYLYVDRPFDFWYENKDKLDIDVNITLGCLEDSKEMTMKRFMIKALWRKLGIRLDMHTANCYFEDKQVNDDIRRAMDSLLPYFEVFESKVRFIDTTVPTGLFKDVKSWLYKPENGYAVNDKGKRLTDRELEEIKRANKRAYEDGTAVHKTSYKSTNDNRFDIFVLDNMNNLSPEKGCATKWDACDRFCRIYGREEMVGKLKMSMLIVCQQTASVEEAQFNNDGEAINAKYMPSLGNISEYKLVAQSSHLVLALFSPYRYMIPQFTPMGSKSYYDILRLQDYYRLLYVLKGNFITANLNTSILFDGVTGTLEELPHAGDVDMEKYYMKCQDLIMRDRGIKPVKIS